MRLRALSLSLLLLATPASAASAGETAAAPPLLFGTEETFSRDISPFTKWTGVLERFAAERHNATHLCAPGASEDCEPAEWSALVAALADADLRTKLVRVNAAINRHPYIPSMSNWGESNRWETPFEFLRKSGQCQDYAIAKYLLLREAGVPASLLRIVVLRDLRQGLDHAVTVAFVDGEALMLDNQFPEVVPTAAAPHYQPYYSINEEGWWLHLGANARYATLNRTTVAQATGSR